MKTAFLNTPIGNLEITGNDEGIVSIAFTDATEIVSSDIPNCLKDCVRQLQEYFSGQRNTFSLVLQPTGTNFQKKVWNSIQNIPFGKTTSYKEQSSVLDTTKAIRAIANANAKNPLLIVIPCHRIIGSNGELTGYSGGRYRKKWLLDYESKNKQYNLFDSNTSIE